MPDSIKKKVLILSWNFVPCDNTELQISATGMRCYKLAIGIADNQIGVTIAVKNYDESMGGYVKNTNCKLISWVDDSSIINVAKDYDIVLINAGYGESALSIIQKLPSRVIKVVDAFIPYFLEEAVMHRSIDKYIATYNRILSLADVLIVAHVKQQNYYLGALLATNILNYSNVGDFRRRVVVSPPGVTALSGVADTDPYRDYRSSINDRKIIIWYGSLYNWYDINPLLEIYNEDNGITKESILFVLGAKNPNYKTKSINRNINSNNIIFIPWIKYDDRLSWIANCSVGVSINKDTWENDFSYRNRLLDYVEVKKPFITNGGDPLGELLINEKYAIKTKIDNLYETILNFINNGYETPQDNSFLDNYRLHEDLRKALLETEPLKNRSNKVLLYNELDLQKYAKKSVEIEKYNYSIEIDKYKLEIENMKQQLLEQKNLYNEVPKTLNSMLKKRTKVGVKKIIKKTTR